jgi:adenylate kinase
MHVILMGPQGSGKGTQSEHVRSRLRLASVATGELFRSAIKSGSPLGQRIKAVYDRGELVPDDLTIDLVEERLDQLAKETIAGEPVRGALYDGFPRTEAQAEALERVLADRGDGISAVIAIDVPRAVLIERLAGRRVCSQCGRVYNVASDPPSVEGICNVCGGALVQRADDTPEAVVKRLDVYEVETAPLANRYAEQGLLARVDGDRTIGEVTDAIVAAIKEKAPLAAAGRR